MIDKKLKPCPFCGGEAEIRGKKPNRTWVWILCRSCRSESHGAYSEEEAIDQWNRRVGDSDETD